jgi:sigma-B regulation protein RsbU (phosphoserine phosphatase)
VALLLALGGISVLVFSRTATLVYLVFPLLTWAALRFWQPGAAAGSLLVAAIAVGFTANGKGPFAESSPDDRLLLAQTFVAVAGITTLFLAAATRERRRAELAERDIASTLQQSLVPGELPELPMIDHAAYFRAAGGRNRVGGDFYDLFEVSPGRWAITVGDVCGKGARAAALTGLARHTLRAASRREQLPSRVLGSLNEAVLRQEDEGALCTAVYGTLDLIGSSAALAMSNGGHPVPLILRAAGGVEQLGEPGTLLGLDPPPSLRDHRVELAAGDAVLFYTDGLLDAYAPQRIVQPSELESVLRSCSGRSAEEIVAEIERSLLSPRRGEPRDDVAMLVIKTLAEGAG